MITSLDLCIPFSDLTRISIKCNCGAETTLNMAMEQHRTFDWEKRMDLPQCPMCHRSFDEKIRSILFNFAKCFDDKVLNDGICFRLSVPFAEITGRTVTSPHVDTPKTEA